MGKQDTSVSLIVSTYNWKEALNLCLKSIEKQTVLPKEVVIADDGSKEDTKALIANIRKNFPVPIIHVWHEDQGFQLSKIRNRAIARASGDYIIQVDGDLILEHHFIQDHIAFRKPGSFVSGSRVIMNKELSQKLLDKGSTKIRLTNSGLINRMNGVRIPALSKQLDNYKNEDIYYVRGCNMAFWRKDLVAINGYNEDFIGWGREDNEIALRLIYSGLVKRIIKFSGVVFHIYHPEKARTALNINDQLLQETASKRLNRCENGLDKY